MSIESASTDWVSATLHELEKRSVVELALQPCGLPQRLRHALGRWKGRDVRLHARAYRGPRTALARFVGVSAPGLSIANILAVPVPSLVVPVLGIEIVRLEGREPLLVADLSPVEAPSGDAPIELRNDGALGDRLPLPAWFRAIASDHASMLRVREAEVPSARTMLRDLVSEFARRVDGAVECPARAHAVAAAIDRYAALHRSEDRGLSLLAKIFGADWARLFVHHVLFPPALAMFRANTSAFDTRSGDPCTPT